MKRILFSSLALLGLLAISSNSAKAQTEEELVQICGSIAGDATYLKDFKIKLDAGDPPPIQRFSAVLKKDVKYRFTVCNSKDYDGQVVLNLMDNNRTLASTHVAASGKDYPTIDWVCSKTGGYHLFFRFREGKEGMAVGLISMVEML